MADPTETSIFNGLGDTGEDGQNIESIGGTGVKDTSVQTEDPTQASLGDAANVDGSTPATSGEAQPSDAQGADGSLPAPADVGVSADPTQAGAQAPTEPALSETDAGAGSNADAGVTPAPASQDGSAPSDSSGQSPIPTGSGVAENPLPEEHPTPATGYNPVNPTTGLPATEQELGDAPAAPLDNATPPFTPAPEIDAPAPGDPVSTPAPEQPATDAPVTDAPASDAPATEAPAQEPAADPTPAPAAPASQSLDEAYTSLTEDGQALFDALDKVEDDFGTIAALELQGLANHASSLRLKLEAALDHASQPGLEDTKFGDLYAMLRGIEDEVADYLNKADTQNKESMLGDNIRSAIATLKQFAKEAYDKLKGGI